MRYLHKFTHEGQYIELKNKSMLQMFIGSDLTPSGQWSKLTNEEKKQRVNLMFDKVGELEKNGELTICDSHYKIVED